MRSWVARHLVALGSSLRILAVLAAANLPVDVFEVLDLMAESLEASIFKGAVYRSHILRLIAE